MGDDDDIDYIGEIRTGGREKGKIRETSFILEAHVHATVKHDGALAHGY